jgi:hypothetical protein
MRAQLVRRVFSPNGEASGCGRAPSRVVRSRPAIANQGSGVDEKAVRVRDTLYGRELRLGPGVVDFRQSLDLLDVEYGILCAAEIYAEHQFGANDLPVLDQNLLHIIRERHRQRSSMPWQDWKLLRYNTRKAAMQRWVNFYASMGRS